MAADLSYTPKIYKKDGGDTQVVASGGVITVESGGTLQLQAGAIADITDKLLAGGDIALADGKILIGDATGKGVANTPSGDVTITNAGVTAIGANKVVTAMILDANVTTAKIADANVTNAKLAAGAGVAALVAAGLGNSASYIKTDTGTKTLLAAHATKNRGVLVLVHIDETFATGDTSQLILKIGETGTIEKCAAAATFTNAAAGSDFVFGFVNTSTNAIIATLTAAAGTGTGGASITVLALPNS